MGASHISHYLYFFSFNDTATTEIYTLSLHDALPISGQSKTGRRTDERDSVTAMGTTRRSSEPCSVSRVRRSVLCHWINLLHRDRKSTRLNSSHANISYAVFCLKKKNNMTALML